MDDPTGPDIRAGWDTLADAYQREVGWPDGELAWGLRCPPERDLQLISDVAADADTLVVGCGGGQDLLALAALGARSLVGVDPSEQQLAHAAKRLSDRGVRARLVRGIAEDMDGLDDAGFDVVVSVQAFNYVQDLDAAVREVRRVLRPGGVLAFSVLHPADVSTDDAAPHGWHTSWFQVQRDWVWDGLADRDVVLRSWFRSAADWFTALHDGGLVVDRLIEPPPVDDTSWIERGWLDRDTYDKLDRIPGTILVRAHEPHRADEPPRR